MSHDVEYCRCHPRKRILKTSGQSEWMCGRCYLLVSEKADAERVKELHPLIRRIRGRAK
jgi:hypothetical protein